EGEAIALRNLEIDDPAAAPACALRFAHDRVQQAAYALTPEADRPALHLRVGRHLLARPSADEVTSEIFDIVGHFNRGLPLVDTWEERLSLARLNLRAAERAQGASAFDAAHTYYKTGADLLAADGWSRARELAFALSLGAAESAC